MKRRKYKDNYGASTSLYNDATYDYRTPNQRKNKHKNKYSNKHKNNNDNSYNNKLGSDV